MKGEQLQSTRKNLGLSQEQLADALGVARNTVSRWERDDVPIPPYLDLALKQIEAERADISAHEERLKRKSKKEPSVK